jgi:hypothetical protein
MSWSVGTFVLSAYDERTLYYYWGTEEAGLDRGPQVALPGTPLPQNGALLAIAQGIRNTGNKVDQRILYLVTVKNIGVSGSFFLRGGGLS